MEWNLVQDLGLLLRTRHTATQLIGTGQQQIPYETLCQEANGNPGDYIFATMWNCTWLVAQRWIGTTPENDVEVNVYLETAASLGRAYNVVVQNPYTWREMLYTGNYSVMSGLMPEDDSVVESDANGIAHIGFDHSSFYGIADFPNGYSSQAVAPRSARESRDTTQALGGFAPFGRAPYESEMLNHLRREGTNASIQGAITVSRRIAQLPPSPRITPVHLVQPAPSRHVSAHVLEQNLLQLTTDGRDISGGQMDSQISEHGYAPFRDHHPLEPAYSNEPQFHDTYRILNEQNEGETLINIGITTPKHSNYAHGEINGRDTPVPPAEFPDLDINESEEDDELPDNGDTTPKYSINRAGGRTTRSDIPILPLEEEDFAAMEHALENSPVSDLSQLSHPLELQSPVLEEQPLSGRVNHSTFSPYSSPAHPNRSISVPHLEESERDDAASPQPSRLPVDLRNALHDSNSLWEGLEHILREPRRDEINAIADELIAMASEGQYGVAISFLQYTFALWQALSTQRTLVGLESLGVSISAQLRAIFHTFKVESNDLDPILNLIRFIFLLEKRSKRLFDLFDNLPRTCMLSLHILSGAIFPEKRHSWTMAGRIVDSLTQILSLIETESPNSDSVTAEQFLRYLRDYCESLIMQIFRMPVHERGESCIFILKLLVNLWRSRITTTIFPIQRLSVILRKIYQETLAIDRPLAALLILAAYPGLRFERNKNTSAAIIMNYYPSLLVMRIRRTIHGGADEDKFKMVVKSMENVTRNLHDFILEM
ncbi:hypothetical protein M422DRAFT_30261 [Sphaerobolus stellatus SS14]|uniref:Uncharacterized protein n=1 Tax=Sphaerobolus stellatus (strain SS14) TaxID=990650 RepID=A0A0C9UPF8_SPHS4|nr:hypothetical protein M422DRAFT_30261 [Sphaerobolus stellatus SS14]